MNKLGIRLDELLGYFKNNLQTALLEMVQRIIQPTKNPKIVHEPF